LEPVGNNLTLCVIVSLSHVNGLAVCLVFSQEMASNKDQIPESPAKKRKIDILKDSMQSGSEELDTLLTSCLYHISKGDSSQCTNLLERIRRRIKAQQASHAIQIKQVALELAATKQKLDGLQRRETYLCRQNGALQSKIDHYKSFLSFEDDFEDSFVSQSSQASEGADGSQQHDGESHSTPGTDQPQLQEGGPETVEGANRCDEKQEASTSGN
jgi:hypothetical protein